MIVLDRIGFAYKTGAWVFDGFSWQVTAGESWAVIGPSGCGKTTLLYLIAGLYPPAGGTIAVAGEQVPRRSRGRTGLILQDYGLLPWATIGQNAALGLRIREFYGLEDRGQPLSERVEPWLKRLGIDELRDKFPSQVSGGQRQRAAIARTLAMEPDVLLMDEPFSSLDALTREDLQDLILELQREVSLTTVVVTHSIEEAALLGRRILVLGQPPNRAAQRVENPGAGRSDYRHQPAFLECCAELRSKLAGV
jgi:ABC-type nitrate/sulfonate/bicarbonate transport system ATPase subunit